MQILVCVDDLFLMIGFQSWQHCRGKSLLEEANGQSALEWYSNDTSPLTTRDVQRTHIGEVCWLQKSRVTSEYVLQSMLIFTSLGKKHALIFEPLRVADRTAATHFECHCASTLPYCRRLMPEAILVGILLGWSLVFCLQQITQAVDGNFSPPSKE